MCKKIMAVKVMLIVLLFPFPSFAYDEIWGTVVLRKSMSENQQLVGEFRRRDTDGLVGAGKSSDLFRLSWSWKADQLTYTLGMTYADFESNTSHELRVHQFLIWQNQYKKMVSAFIRSGTEHRDFSSDAKTYHRARFRLQLNPLPTYPFGTAFYNESFFAFNGGERFVTGFNENRTGVGLRYTFESFEIYGYQTFVYLKNVSTTVHQDWIQFQIVFNF